ncbi:hypothetical protein ACIOBL_09950 [Paenibacillus taichungensis]
MSIKTTHEDGTTLNSIHEVASPNNVKHKTSAFLFAGVGGATAGAMRSQA